MHEFDSDGFQPAFLPRAVVAELSATCARTAWATLTLRAPDPNTRARATRRPFARRRSPSRLAFRAPGRKKLRSEVLWLLAPRAKPERELRGSIDAAKQRGLASAGTVGANQRDGATDTVRPSGNERSSPKFFFVNT